MGQKVLCDREERQKNRLWEDFYPEDAGNMVLSTCILFSFLHLYKTDMCHLKRVLDKGSRMDLFPKHKKHKRGENKRGMDNLGFFFGKATFAQTQKQSTIKNSSEKNKRTLSSVNSFNRDRRRSRTRWSGPSSTGSVDFL